MIRLLSFVTAPAAVAAVLAIGGAAQGGDVPLWAQHVQNYGGGISNGVRSRLVGRGFRSRQAASLRSPDQFPRVDP